MKKTTVRFVAVGAVMLLGALALALAHHDARQRTHETAVISKPPAQAPQPIPLGDSPLWSDREQGDSGPSVVRANDDGLGDMPPAIDFKAPAHSSLSDDQPDQPAAHAQINPLRGGALPLAEDGISEQFNDALGNSSVELASGEGPPTLPPAGSLAAPPALPPTGQLNPTGQLPAPSSLPGSDAVIKSPPPGWMQTPPALPPSTMAGSTPPPLKQPSSALLSEPQRPAMPPTSLGTIKPPAVAGPPASLNPPSSLQAPVTPPSFPTSGDASPGLPTTLSSPAAMPPAATLGSPRPASTGNLSDRSMNDRGLNDRSMNDRGVSGALTGANTSLPRATSQLTDSTTGSPFTGTMLGRLISNQPGNSHLDGSQNPIMLIHKRMAGECQVGKRTTVVITVRNAGNSTAQDVEVIDSVPNGASFAESIPAVTPTTEGILVWKLGEMGPGDERTINLQIIPERQGELGSTAAVRFAAQASVRTLATLPKLELSYNAAPDVLIGSTHALEVTVKNVGTGVAKAVKLEADLPTHMRHDSGDSVLEAVFGDIAPGENKRIRLDTIAAEPGAAMIALRALTEDGVQQEQKVDLQIMAPALEAAITGPNRRYLDRQATYEIMIKNPGTAAATKCEFMLRLPNGLNFNTANKEGRYDAAQHAILWSVPEFPAGYQESVEFTVLPVEIGTQQMTFQGFADLGVKAEARGSLTVEEQGELTFSITQDADPIEISASTTYTVEVRNVGRPDRNVELSLQLPAGSEILRVDAPVKEQVVGDVLRFAPVPQMDGRSTLKYRIEVRHGKVGVQIVRAQLKSENRPTLVIKEEATEVYNDRD